MLEETNAATEAAATSADMPLGTGSKASPSPDVFERAFAEPLEVNDRVENAALAKAKEGGYVEPESPSRDKRINTLIADVAHAMHSNAPMAPSMFNEMKALLTGEA